MKKFKVGDKLRRTDSNWHNVKTGDIVTVKELSGSDMVLFEECKGIYSIYGFELVKEKMKKKFKNKIAVTGSVSLLKALVEELEKIGYYNHSLPSSSVFNVHKVILINRKECGDGTYLHQDSHLSSNYDYNLTLPQDWDKALELASEVEEIKPKFKKGDWIYNSGDTYEFIGKCEDVIDGSVYIDEYYQIFLSDKPLMKITKGQWLGIESRLSSATKEQVEKVLLEVANFKYPKGTKYKNIKYSNFKEVRGTLGFYTDHNTRTQITDGYGGSVYFNGEWSEIVKDEKPNLDLFSHSVEYNTTSREFKIGCQHFTLEYIKSCEIVLLDERVDIIRFWTDGNFYSITKNKIEKLLKFREKVVEYEQRN